MRCKLCGSERIHVQKKRLCRNCYDKHLRSTNPEYAQRQRDNARKWAERNPGKIKQYKQKRLQREQKLKKDPTRRRHLNAQKVYGLSPDAYERLVANGCAICGSTERLRVDHDHNTGRIRGCLCHFCNIGLGFVERPNQWLDRALAYLRLAQADER